MPTLLSWPKSNNHPKTLPARLAKTQAKPLSLSTANRPLPTLFSCPKLKNSLKTFSTPLAKALAKLRASSMPIRPQPTRFSWPKPDNFAKALARPLANLQTKTLRILLPKTLLENVLRRHDENAPRIYLRYLATPQTAVDITIPYVPMEPDGHAAL